MATDYRAIARFLAALHAVRPSRWSVCCAAGCGAELSIDAPASWDGAGWDKDMRRVLARQVLEAEWDLDAMGRIACPCCHAAMRMRNEAGD